MGFSEQPPRSINISANNSSFKIRIDREKDMNSKYIIKKRRNTESRR